MKLKQSALIACLCLGITTSCSSVQNTVNPQQGMYYHVWQLVDDEYYDTTALRDQNFSRWEHRYDGKLHTLDDAHKAIETMLSSLGNGNTRFLSKAAFEEEKYMALAKVAGVGIQIGLDKKHHLVVIAPSEHSPASESGIQSGDQIAEIDGKPTEGETVEDAAMQIRGLSGTKVTLTLKRATESHRAALPSPDQKEQLVRVALIRRSISIRALGTAQILPGDIGYIRLDNLNANAAAEMRDALKSMSGAKGLVLDLRYGLQPLGSAQLSSAIDIADMFAKEGTIVSTIDRDRFKTPAVSEGKPIYSP